MDVHVLLYPNWLMLPFEFELDIGALLFASDYVTNLYCEIILSKFFYTCLSQCHVQGLICLK